MPTRIKRPSLWRPLAVTVALAAFQGYLGYNVWRGQFGIDNRAQMLTDIEELRAQSASLKAEIDSFHHRVSLFDPSHLDPDILSERARALLNMAQPDDLLVMVDPASGRPLLGPADPALDSAQLSSIITGSTGQ